MNRFILIFVCTFFFTQFACTQDRVDSKKVLKILTFNIFHGETMKGDFDLDVIAKVIVETDPDLVALQEVDYKTKRARGMDLATELGWRTGMTSIFGKAMDYDGGEYGEGLLSKHTFLQSRNIPLPFTPGNEPRTALEIVTILPSNDTIAFVGTHLDHLEDEKDRLAQVKWINRVFSRNLYPTILAGDLNAIPGSTAINLLEEIWTPSYDPDCPQSTYPSNEPVKKIDYIMFYPGDRWNILERRVIADSIASDHCALLVIVELMEER